jgi:hypothetical protein
MFIGVFIEFLILILITLSFGSDMKTSSAYAHITKQIGNLKVEVGWSKEPALTGRLFLTIKSLYWKRWLN